MFSLPPQPLDFETEPVTSIVFKAENPEPLVNGIEYNASSFASFELTVTDVNEVPVFPQRIFQANVSEDTAIGTKVGTVTARDPEGLTVRYRAAGLGRPIGMLARRRAGKAEKQHALASGLGQWNRHQKQGLWPWFSVSNIWLQVSFCLLAGGLS